MKNKSGFRNIRKERPVLFTPRKGTPEEDYVDDMQTAAVPAKTAAVPSETAGAAQTAAVPAETAGAAQTATVPAQTAGAAQTAAVPAETGATAQTAKTAATAESASTGETLQNTGSSFLTVDLVVIGGGAAGMAAAVSAHRNGVRDILILERNSSLGGVLMQCIHNGFGLHRFGEDLTGVEFAARYADMVTALEIPYLLNTFVISLDAGKTITAVNPEKGLMEIRANSIVLAMGCRERSRNALLIPGARGAGIMTAGTAQRYLNIEGYLPGKRIVIVGSGDIGLIMARQFVLEGCEVAAVVEIMPWSGGLPRNMKQCIEDFDIPVYYNSVITQVCGKERVTSVMVGKVDEHRRLLPGTEFEIPCDTLLISAGLIPENELTEAAGIRMSPATKGAEVSESLETSIPGVFSCGNVLHVHDLVDFVSEEGEEAGRNAARYLQRSSAPAQNSAPMYPANSGSRRIPALSGAGVGGIVPQYVLRDTPQSSVTFMFRPKNRFRDAVITAASGEKELFRKRFPSLTPGEMCRVQIPAEKLADAGEILFSIDGTTIY